MNLAFPPIPADLEALMDQKRQGRAPADFGVYGDAMPEAANFTNNTNDGTEAERLKMRQDYTQYRVAPMVEAGQMSREEAERLIAEGAYNPQNDPLIRGAAAFEEWRRRRRAR